MLWSILSPIFYSFATIFYKKSLSSKVHVSPTFFSLLWFSAYIFFLLYFFVTHSYSFVWVNWLVLATVIIVSSLWTIVAYISIYVYSNEKISVITPYENLNKVLSITFSYFLFHDVTIPALIVWIAVICVIIFGSLDLKNLQFPRFIKVFFLHQILTSLTTLGIGYALTKITSVDYFILENIFMIGMYIAILLYKKEISEVKKGNVAFHKNRFLSSLMDALGYFISLTIISSIGVSMNIIISFLYLAFILILSYIFLSDAPDRKSILFSLIICILVSIAFYLNTI